MNFNDLFFTLLLYRKAKTHQYRFYNCLVSHDGAYIDVNRFIEPTDTVTVAFKIYGDDIENRINRPNYNNPQQWIICARRDSSDPNTMMISPIWHWNSSYGWEMDVNDVIIIDNGNGTLNRSTLAAPYFDKKLIVTLYPDGSQKIVTVNKEKEENSPSPSSVARALDNNGRALLKLFAGFEPEHGGLCYNTAVTRIYSFYIQNANLQYTLRLQPAERRDTGEFGMYDAINDTFYPNKNSIGYFTAESNITDSIILDVESQIDTKRLAVYCTSNNMPYQFSDGKLLLVSKHNLPPITEGFIDLWDGMGKQSDEEGIFNHVVLQRNDTGDVTYIDNEDGSVSVSVPNITGHGTDFTRWAYKLANVAVGSIVIVGKCNGGFVIMNYSGDTPSSNGSLRWYTDGRIQNNITEDYEDATYSSIFTAENPHTYTASGNAVIDSGGTLIGAVYDGICNIKIYGMALYTTILTKEQLLEVAHWLDRYVKRPVSNTRSTTEELNNR